MCISGKELNIMFGGNSGKYRDEGFDSLVLVMLDMLCPHKAL